MSTRFVSIAICGPRGAGKTALTRRLLYGEFDKQLHPTLGTDVFGKILEKDGVQLVIYDHAGDVTRLGAKERQFDIILVVFDVSQQQQLNEALLLLQQHQAAGFATNRFILVGNKTDLPRETNSEATRIAAYQYTAKYMEISCRLGTGIDDLLETILRRSALEHQSRDQKKRPRGRTCFERCWNA